VPLRKFEATLDRLLAIVSAAAKTVLLSGIGDLGTIPRLLPPLRQLMTARARAGNAAQARVAARYGALLADHWGWSRAEFIDNPAMFASDHFHASAGGHAVWAEVVWEALAPWLDHLREAPG
jgi:lysophospholipase L1-like esterase